MLTERDIKTAVAVAAAALALLPAAASAATTITVNTTADNAAGGSECSGVAGDCSLRQAMDKAATGDTIVFAASLDGQTITLTGGVLSTSFKGMTIAGPGPSELTINGNGAANDFSVDGGGNTGASSTISGLTLTGATGGAVSAGLNNSTGSNSLTLANDDFTNNTVSGGSVGCGGAGLNGNLTASDNLTITDSVISNNTATGACNGAGALTYGPGDTTISNTAITNNTVHSSNATAGGLFLQGSATITDSTFANNAATATSGGANAGALYAQGSSLQVTGSTFSGNSTTANGSSNSSGGALFIQSGTVAITNSTFTGNSSGSSGSGSGFGGAIFKCCSAAPANLVNVTIDANSATGASSSGGNVASGDGSVTVSALNTIIADGSATKPSTSNCGEAETSVGHDLSSGACFPASGNLLNTEPDLAPLASNGGPTQTMALLAGSPAIDAGSPAASCPATDQRGDPRPDSGQTNCDIGAFELQGSTGPAPPGGGSGPGSGTGTAPKPACTISAKSTKVLLAALDNARAAHRAKGKPGTVQFTVRCNQAASVRLAGKVIEALPGKHAGKHTKSFALRATHATTRVNTALALTIKLPGGALAALKAGDRESVNLTLTASDANGTSTISLRISRLRTARR